MIKRLFIDMDGTLIPLKGQDGKMNITNWDDPNLFKNKRPIKTYIKAIKESTYYKEADVIYVLTSVPIINFKAHKECKEKEILKILPNVKILAVPSNISKNDYVCELFDLDTLSKNDILIDDTLNVLCDWENAKGKASHISSLIK